MNELQSKLEKIVSDLKSEIATLRTGRASPVLVEDLEVEAYGSRQPLKTLAAISIPEPRQVLIQPWDKSLLPAVEKAVQSSSLGLNPIVDKDVIRLFLPALTEERKRDIVKALKERLESARILVRRARDEAMKEIDAEEKAKTISEDEKFRRKQEVEKTVGECNKQIEDTGTKKEREIMAG